MASKIDGLEELRRIRRALETIVKIQRLDQRRAAKFDKDAKANERELDKLRKRERTQDWIPPLIPTETAFEPDPLAGAKRAVARLETCPAAVVSHGAPGNTGTCGAKMPCAWHADRNAFHGVGAGR